MLRNEREIIERCLEALVDKTKDVHTLALNLVEKRVFTVDMINHILDPSFSDRRKKTDFYLAIARIGPEAFKKLQMALRETNNNDLANLLEQYSIGTNGINHREEMDGPCLSRQNPTATPQSPQRPNSLPTSSISNSHPHRSHPYDQDSNKNEDTLDSSPVSGHLDFRNHAYPFKFDRFTSQLKEDLKNAEFTSNDVINIRGREVLPVRVKPARSFKHTQIRGPKLYKMDSKPRGYVFLVNNIHFLELETRQGAENDERRLIEFFEQCYFVVEPHRDKTKEEMDTLVRDFSLKEELNNVDCAIIIFMSHGDEGDYEEDTEILGVDEQGLKTNKIVGYFHHDHCPALLEKPKIFLFQACRGKLDDLGVSIGSLAYRTKTDGKKIKLRSEPIRARTVSDVFIAHPVPPGRTANRDIYRGTWFMQTIVDVFSEHACESDLEDLMKLVDHEIKGMNTLLSRNFQTVTTRTLGWNKKFFFNPGLHKIGDQTVRTLDSCTPSSEGTDMVDTINTRKEGCNQKKNYSRLNDHHGEDDDMGCYPKGRCNPC